MAQYDIYVRDGELQKMGHISDYTELQLVMKFNDAGKWTLTLPIEARESINLLLQARRQGGGIGGIVVTRDGIPFFSGPIKSVEMQEGWIKDDNYFTASGIDDNGLLLSRLAMPPDQAGNYRASAGTGIGYDVATGPTETVIKHLVDVNATAFSVQYREIPHLIVQPDEARGETITIRSRYHPLIEKLQEAALTSNLGWRVRQLYILFEPFPIFDGLYFDVYEPEDKTGSLVFSKERGNLAGYRYFVEASEANFILVGGSGEGTERVFAYTGDEPSRVLYGTIEYFHDQRQITDYDELLQSLYNELEEKTEKAELEIEPLDVEGTRFIDDYHLGDRATVEVQDEIIEDVIRSISITLNKDGVTIVPTVGTPGVGTTFRLFDDFRRLQGRVGKIEKR